MNAPTSPFQLARMRHVDLLTMWHLAHPHGRERDNLAIARMTKDTLAALILTQT